MKQLAPITICLLCFLAISQAAMGQCSFSLSAAANGTCPGANNGTIDLTVTGGTGPFTYLWQNGNITEDLSGLTAGNYTVTVTDGLACTATQSALVFALPNPVADAGISNTLTCDVWSLELGSNNSSVGPDFSYNWTGPGIHGGNFNILHPTVTEAGTYFLQVTDGTTGCTATDQVVVLLDVVSPIANAGPDQLLNCAFPSAQLDGSASSAGPNFTYFWNTIDGVIFSGTSSPVASVGAAGTYTLIITNTQNGCTASDIAIVTQDFDIPTANAGIDTGIPCGGTEVQLDGTGSAQGPTITYLWAGPGIQASNMNTINPIVQVSGTYTLLVTDIINGCTASDEVVVFNGPAIPQQNFELTHLTCSPGALGAIDLSVNFGTAPYTYQWSNSSTTQDITNLSAGNYQVWVTDATNCIYQAQVTLNQAVSDMLIGAVSTPPSCFGLNDGNINVTVTNGTSPYTYAWIGPAGYTSTVEDPTGLPSGNYSLTVTDVSGCTATRVINVSAPTSMSLPNGSIAIINPTCFGGTDGAIFINPIGGQQPYTFDWNNDGPETPDNDPQNLSGLPAGNYRVTITSANGCTLESSTINLTQPAALQVNASVFDVPCGGTGNTGLIQLFLSGQLPPFDFKWSSGATTQDLVVSSGGTYTVTITQTNGCTSIFSTQVLQGGEVIPGSDFSVTPTTCAIGSINGAIVLNTLPPSAQAPLSYSWKGPNGFTANTKDITGLEAGSYNLTLTDATYCQFVAFVLVDRLPSDIMLSQGNTSSSCNGTTVDLLVNGGAAPYVYVWTNGYTQEDLVYTQSGNYGITVTDMVGCTASASFDLTAAPTLSIDITATPISCNGGADGAIALSVSNGSGNYTFDWSNGAITPDLTGIAAGVYCVTVTDALGGCTKSACYTLAQPTALTASIIDSSQPSCFGVSNGSFTLNFSGGAFPPYTWSIDDPIGQSGNVTASPFTISGLPNGSFCVTLTNANGCSTTTCGSLIADPAPVASIEVLSNNCNAAVLQANIVGGTPPYSYSWEGGVTIPDITPIITAPVSSIYQVLVLDANGCGDFATIDVELANGGNCGYVTGFVQLDDNLNCTANVNEPALSGWLVRAEGADTLYGITDANGRYLIGAPTGTYHMAAIPPNSLWQACPFIPSVTITMSNDTAFGGKLPVQKVKDCYALNVSIGTNLLRRCFSNNYYAVNYCNEGTAVAENAYVEVVLDPFLTFMSATLQGINMGSNTWRFLLGDLDIGECGAFSIRVQVSCSANLGQTLCTEAHIYPDTLCTPSALWSGANLQLRSICETDSLRFVIQNVGQGNMSTVVDYIVVEDAVMFKTAPLPLLNAGESMDLRFPANGSNWYLEVGQEAYHPYPSPVGLSIEGCTTSASFSTGFTNQFPLDEPEPFVDIDCTTIIGSYDPNDKQGYPLGYGAAHFVRPGTELEYLVRFQNTGTDTAFTVRIVDTLSSWLDPTTVRFGASSHPYRYDLCGEGIVHFIFDNILLPDSNVNEAASHGFAKFRIKPKAEAPLGAKVKNNAAIYFDYNDPVITNTTQHQLGENFIKVGTWQPVLPQVVVEVTPNPFDDQVRLEVKGLPSDAPILLQVFDYQGIEYKNMRANGTLFQLKKGNLPAGVYFFKITQSGKTVGSGKLIAE